MPVPKRKKGEMVSKYRSRLISFFIREGKKSEQALAISYKITGTSHKKKKKRK